MKYNASTFFSCLHLVNVSLSVTLKIRSMSPDHIQLLIRPYDTSNQNDNKNKKISSFKSNENIHKKKDGSYDINQNGVQIIKNLSRI